MEKSMYTTLKIPAAGGLDLVALGALVHRLDPGHVPFRKAHECHVHVSGMVDYPIGELIAERVRAMGVRPFYKHFAHDGVTGPNMATVFSDRGHGVRAPVVFYNRSNEAG